MKKFVLLSLLGFLSIPLITSVYADIPARDNLILELGTNGTFSDTSGNGRTIKQFGDVVPMSATGGSISYANFSGSGQLAPTLSWSAGGTTPFTISSWIKTSQADRSIAFYDCQGYGSGARYYTGTDFLPNYVNSSTFNQASLLPGCWIGYWVAQQYVSYGGTKPLPANTTYWNGYIFGNTGSGKILHSEPVTQTIFSFRKGSGALATDMGIQIKPDFTCVIESGVGAFDCGFLKDGGWHNLTLRRDYYQTLEIFVDGKVVSTIRNANITTSRYLYIGRSSTGSYTDFKGWLGGFRIYNSSISNTDIAWLYSENSSQVIAASPNAPIISINQPNALSATFKKVTASTNTGELYFAMTTGDVCNETLFFEDYTDLIFSSTADNGTRICYKANNWSFISFKLSDAIRGVTWTNTSFEGDNIFGDGDVYKSWATSPRAKIADYTRSVLGTITGTNFVDINGDGLIDIMYNSYLTNAGGYLGILVNTGDYSFKPVYKCRVVTTGAPNYIPTYYGDCADTNFR